MQRLVEFLVFFQFTDDTEGESKPSSNDIFDGNCIGID